MRYLLVPLLVVGCSSTGESRGTTAKEYGGPIPVLFINATPEKLCGLYISHDNEAEYGDNWLPVNGLDVGKELQLLVKPGTYKAKWNTCNDARDRPTVNYSATLVGGTAFPIDEPLQLYAFVSDGTPPTKRGVPRPRMKMVKFIGQTTEIAAGSATDTPPTEPAPSVSAPRPAPPVVAPPPPIAPPPAAAPSGLWPPK